MFAGFFHRPPGDDLEMTTLDRTNNLTKIYEQFINNRYFVLESLSAVRFRRVTSLVLFAYCMINLVRPTEKRNFDYGFCGHSILSFRLACPGVRVALDLT